MSFNFSLVLNDACYTQNQQQYHGSQFVGHYITKLSVALIPMLYYISCSRVNLYEYRPNDTQLSLLILYKKYLLHLKKKMQ